MQTGWTAMRLGAVKYIVPFFFVYSPALLMQGTWVDIVLHTTFAAVGVTMVGSALEGYLVGVGRLNPLLRIGLLVAGGLIAFPEIYTTVAGLILIAVCLAAHFFRRFRLKETGKIVE
jgi:TRAP-type uncharacterized transport system fused permease subunit